MPEARASETGSRSQPRLSLATREGTAAAELNLARLAIMSASAVHSGSGGGNREEEDRCMRREIHVRKRNKLRTKGSDCGLCRKCARLATNDGRPWWNPAVVSAGGGGAVALT